ncbi:hypothetical protein RCL_jg4982.t1 [Rhizophagus clarus]|uniref:Uncharacterized protein n=1 Tax=Rhizophagus clarus TaxID=94130 RepID=A0A8H3QK62_9GLOM|nr:hypothetical protein RCL_jg4982.t1 [Rhizophagus clarus]
MSFLKFPLIGIKKDKSCIIETSLTLQGVLPIPAGSVQGQKPLECDDFLRIFFFLRSEAPLCIYKIISSIKE